MSSLSKREKTCAACGNYLLDDDFKIEILIDGIIRPVVVHSHCSIFSHRDQNFPPTFLYGEEEHHHVFSYSFSSR